MSTSTSNVSRFSSPNDPQPTLSLAPSRFTLYQTHPLFHRPRQLQLKQSPSRMLPPTSLSDPQTVFNFACTGISSNSHLQFLARHLIQGYPARYASQDVSQPWLMYYIMQSFSILQAGLDAGNKQKWVYSLASLFKLQMLQNIVHREVGRGVC